MIAVLILWSLLHCVCLGFAMFFVRLSQNKGLIDDYAGGYFVCSIFFPLGVIVIIFAFYMADSFS